MKGSFLSFSYIIIMVFNCQNVVMEEATHQEKSVIKCV